jgi:probable rRNA maturation factor
VSAGSIAVQCRVRSGVPAGRLLRRWARAALDGAGGGELTLRIVGARESRTLNRRFRGRDRPTNVLSFPYDAPGLLGDVVICAPVVNREAREQRKPPVAHWAHMVMHGVLHLRGYDHETPRDAEKMESRERDLLGACGFPDPYFLPERAQTRR